MTDRGEIRAVAHEVAKLLAPQQLPRLLTPREVALQLSVERPRVYEHAEDLGVVRVGDGPRPRLLFDSAVLAERLRPPPPRRTSKPPPPQTIGDVPLLPIKPPPRRSLDQE